VERGDHDSLYALGGRYFDLYTRQHGIERNLFLAPGEGDVAEESSMRNSDTEPADVDPTTLLR
jgi:subfamily B ATP-binding cassette protein MsbA